MKSILRNFFLSAIITLYSSSVISQVKIHERVTIQTNKLGVDSTDKYMPGQKVISPRINKSVQTTGAMITVPESSYVTIAVVSADAASTIDLILRSPFNQTIISDASGNVGAKWESPFFSTETVLDVGIFWVWRSHSGYEYGVEMTQVAENEYILYFEDLGDLYGPYIDYNDLVVDVRIHGKPDHLSVTVDPDSILYGEYTKITAVAIDNEGNEMLLGENAIMTLSAEPSSIGSFYPSNEVVYSELRDGYVNYWADQEEPTCTQDVVVTVSGEGTSGTAKVVVKRNPCIVMSISSDKIHPGESVDITMQQLGCFGNLMPYPADQYFYIWMNTDAKYGKLRDQSGNEDSYVEGVQPFKFIAADSIDVDTTVVEIEAWTWSGGVISTSIIGVGVEDTLGNPPNASAALNKAHKTAVKSEAGEPVAKILPKPGEILAMRNEAKIKSIELAIDRLDKSINDLLSKENKSKVKGEYSRGFLTDVPSKKSSNATLTKLANLEEKLKKLLAEVKTATAKYTTAQANTKNKLMITSEGVTDCRSVVHITITKEPELVVYPPDDKNLYIQGANLPKMPKPLVKAQLKNYKGGQVEFNWLLTIRWKAKSINLITPKDKTEKYEGNAWGQNSEIVDLEVGETLCGEENMRGGDNIVLAVTCTTKADGKVYSTDPSGIPNPFIIKGENPTLATALGELDGDQYAAVAWHESAHTLHQFGDDGFPLQGVDKWDFGVMQINHPDHYPTWEYNGSNEYNDYRCDDLIWNWVTNVQQGKLMLDKRFNAAKSFHKKEKDASPLTDEQRYRQGYCEYNKGPGKYYWSWMAPSFLQILAGQSGHWVRDDSNASDNLIAGRDYADKVFEPYKKHPWR